MKIFFCTIFLILLNLSYSAQKYAFVDTKYILGELPQYIEAQKKIDDLAEKWQLEIEAKYVSLKQKQNAFQQEKILLPNDTKKQREEELFAIEKEAKELQQKYFGVNGELFKKRKELIEPIQEDIYKAIKNMANEKGYDFIMDKGTNSNILFADPKYDKSDAILKEIKK